MTFFLVIASDFQIFHPDFSNVYHFSPKMSYFLQKTTKKCIFRLILKNPRKTQGPFENPRKNPRPSEKKPRTQDCFEKPKILGENPSSGNAGYSSEFSGRNLNDLRKLQGLLSFSFIKRVSTVNG